MANEVNFFSGDESRIDGQIFDKQGKPKVCTYCQGTRGWRIKDDVITHTACNKVQS